MRNFRSSGAPLRESGLWRLQAVKTRVVTGRPPSKACASPRTSAASCARVIPCAGRRWRTASTDRHRSNALSGLPPERRLSKPSVADRAVAQLVWDACSYLPPPAIALEHLRGRWGDESVARRVPLTRRAASWQCRRSAALCQSRASRRSWSSQTAAGGQAAPRARRVRRVSTCRYAGCQIASLTYVAQICTPGAGARDVPGGDRWSTSRNPSARNTCCCASAHCWFVRLSRVRFQESASQARPRSSPGAQRFCRSDGFSRSK